jgi:DUF971 family protein
MSTAGESAPWPSELRLDAAKTTLNIGFEDGQRFALTAEYLRVESPSAEVQGHVAAQKQIVPEKRNVKIRALEPVGNYAVRIVFDDGHDSGLFTWTYLYELGQLHDRKWADYLRNLKMRALSRG